MLRIRQLEQSVIAEGLASFACGHQLKDNADSKPEGIYAGWDWNGRQLTAYTDAFGFRPLFYRQLDDGIVVSPSIVELLSMGDPPALDYDALAVFLRMGFFIGEDTPYSGVRVLPPNGRLRWNGTLTITGGPWWSEEAQMSYDQAVGGLIELFRDAIQRRPPQSDHYALPLSGGKDSRHILLELLHAGFPQPVCVTTRHYPPRANTDLDSAREVAEHLGVDHEVLDPPPRLRAELSKNIATNLCADEHAWLSGVTDRVRAHGGTTYDGVGGDVLTDSSFFDSNHIRDIATGRPERVAVRLLQGGGRVDDQRVFRSSRPTRELQEIATNKIATEIARYRGSVNGLAMFYFWNRTRREIALMSAGMMRDMPYAYCPFVDQQLYRFLTSVPLRHIAKRTLHHDAIARAHPQAATVPYARYGPRRGAAMHYGRFAAAVGMYALRTRPGFLCKLFQSMPRYLHALVRAEERKTLRFLSPAKLLHALQVEHLVSGGWQGEINRLRPDCPLSGRVERKAASDFRVG